VPASVGARKFESRSMRSPWVRRSCVRSSVSLTLPQGSPAQVQAGKHDRSDGAGRSSASAMPPRTVPRAAIESTGRKPCPWLGRALQPAVIGRTELSSIGKFLMRKFYRRRRACWATRLGRIRVTGWAPNSRSGRCATPQATAGDGEITPVTPRTQNRI